MRRLRMCALHTFSLYGCHQLVALKREACTATARGGLALVVRLDRRQRIRRTDLFQRPGSDNAHIRTFILQASDEWLDGMRVANMPKRFDSVAAHPLIRILQAGDERLYGARVANCPKRRGSDTAYILIRIIQAGDERRDGRLSNSL
jgi:hypothetical protein